MACPAAFSRLVSILLQELNGECVVLFLDDLLVYSRSKEEHLMHLRQLFEILRENKLYAKRSKCSIGVEQVEFLGHKVTPQGVHTQNRIVEDVLAWPVPKSIHDVQRFLGLANYYRKFIRGYAKMVQPISDIVRNHSFHWSELQDLAFKDIKSALTSAPVLAHPDPSKRFEVSTDASKFAVGATLSQDGHPIAYLSHRLSSTEERWDTGDQELLAFIIALREWDVYLKGRPFVFKTDHEPIRYLQTKARLSGRQARWLDLMQSYNYEVQHVPGKLNAAADALSRRPDHDPQLQVLRMEDSMTLQRIKDGYKEDPFCRQLLDVHADGKEPEDSKVSRFMDLYRYDGDFLMWIGANQTRIMVPDAGTLRKDLVCCYHQNGHLGVEKTYSSLSKYLFWPRMHDQVSKIIASCHSCQINKTPNKLPPGELHPHDIPSTTWEVVTTDFLTELPISKKGNDAVLVIVDKLSKRAILVATRKDVDAPEVAQLFQDSLFSKHGVPVSIISDRDPKFTAKYWKCLTQLKNARLNMSTADHPQSDGQSEIMIRTVCNMLRETVQNDKEGWDAMLSQMEYVYSASRNASTGLTPFEVDIGRIPPSPMTRALEKCSVQCQSAVEYVARIDMFKRIARDNLAAAQARQKQLADRSRRPLSFEEGDLVLLRSNELSAFTRADLPTKWRPKYLGPLRVL